MGVPTGVRAARVQLLCYHHTLLALGDIARYTSELKGRAPEEGRRQRCLAVCYYEVRNATPAAPPARILGARPHPSSPPAPHAHALPLRPPAASCPRVGTPLTGSPCARCRSGCRWKSPLTFAAPCRRALPSIPPARRWRGFSRRCGRRVAAALPFPAERRGPLFLFTDAPLSAPNQDRSVEKAVAAARAMESVQASGGQQQQLPGAAPVGHRQCCATLVFLFSLSLTRWPRPRSRLPPLCSEATTRRPQRPTLRCGRATPSARRGWL